MKKFDNLLELANSSALPPGDALWICKHIREWTAGISSKDSFMEHFGGSVYLLEDFQDFAQVTFFGEGFRTRNLLCDYGEFDQCEYLYETKIVVIHQCTSNSGGPTFYIPEHLSLANPFVELSM
jgi:hypothetical protein